MVFSSCDCVAVHGFLRMLPQERIPGRASPVNEADGPAEDFLPKRVIQLERR